MPFNSLEFVLFLTCFTLLFYLKGSVRYKNAIIMTGGIFFFGMAGISNLVFLLCAITITFISVMLHSRFEKKFILGKFGYSNPMNEKLLWELFSPFKLRYFSNNLINNSLGFAWGAIDLIYLIFLSIFVESPLHSK